MAFTLMSCTASKKTLTPKQTNKSEAVLPVNQTETPSAEQLIAQAKQFEGDKQLAFLYNATKEFQSEGNYQKSLYLADSLLALTDNQKQQFDLEVIKANSLFQLAYTERALLILEKASVLADENQLPLSLSYFQVLAQIQHQRNLPVAALDARLQAFSLNTAASEADVEQIWHALTNFSQWQLKQLIKLNPPQIRGWMQLINYANRFGASQQQLNRYLTQWQRQFPTHAGNLIAEQLKLNEYITSENYQKIAVILPLTGNQSAAGQAAQQGILAAYQNTEDKSLFFIDANKTAISELSDIFEEQQVQAVIGPLLKPNVNQYVAEQFHLPTLLLNVPEQQILAGNFAAISMRPEDEAIQAATTLSSKNYKHPMVLSTKDNISQRITRAFVKQWQTINGEAPEVVFLDTEAKMQDELKASLDVHHSQERIKQLRARMRQSVKVEERNRRDIDMIFLVGSPKDSKLLKPYIDVNISPFAEQIPVFASSRSHGAHVDASETRDLTGLIFTEIPWLLPSSQQNKTLKQTSNKLWPRRTETLQKIFAMGYDSYALLEKLQAMKSKPYIRHWGQTGTLKLNNTNIFVRSLLWGRYQKDRVRETAFE